MSVLGFLFYFLMIAFIVVSLFLILLVLIQKGRGGGLSSAFGGMGGNTAFGSKTGDVLTWATSVVFGVFLLLAIVLNLMANTQHARGTVTGVTTPVQPAPAQPAPANGSGEQK
ncbi:MAG TPA: preprotein translocase subunit SecG [Tepidisphaeraceae bacterium]|nr:preprotein translocase subunit SecG [Tepidisphaeraceae bacterium]